MNEMEQSRRTLLELLIAARGRGEGVNGTRPREEVARVGWRRLGVAMGCGYASTWLYLVMTRVVMRMTTAEPTGAGEVLWWVRPLNHAGIVSLLHRTHGLLYTMEFAGCWAGLFALYGVMLWMAKGVRSGWLFAAVAGIGAALGMGVLLCGPAMLSSDVYAYAHYGRVLAAYGADAHAAPPAGSDATDPFLCKGWYEFIPSVYGPLWTVICAGIVKAAGARVGLTLLLMRGLEAGASLWAGGLIWAILRRVAPERAALGLVMYLLNPLVVMESAMGGHNDACMMALALLAVWLHVRGHAAGAAVALMVSALVKVITGPLAPLYIVMTLRGMRGWRERGVFLLKAMGGCAVAVGVSMAGARMSPSGLLIQTASSAAYYENNYHELLFKGVRWALGEKADSLNAPMDFRTYWVGANGRAVLHAGTGNKTEDIALLRSGQPLLVISDEDSDDWLRVYDPVDHLQGYVDWEHLVVIDDPPNAESDATVKRLSGWPPDWPTVVMANRMIRVGTWGLFALFGLVAAWRAVDLETFLRWGTWFFLAALLLVFTRIWPWYVIWPLAYGALRPGSWGARMAVALSAGMMLMNAVFDLVNTGYDWAYDYRSVICIVLPAGVVFCWWGWVGWVRRNPAL